MISKYRNRGHIKKTRKATLLLVILTCLCVFCSCKKEQDPVEITNQTQQTESESTVPIETVYTEPDDVEETSSKTEPVELETNPTEEVTKPSTTVANPPTEIPYVPEETQLEDTVVPGDNETDLQ